jgi:2-polyprenyl-3-methyl-5-hydroxy-6-metoxy-1,4-benzoquinol methylase
MAISPASGSRSRSARRARSRVSSICSGSRILDLPCGYGRHSNALADRGYQVTGLDLDAEHLAKARESARARFREGDMREIDADLHGRFDAVINMFYSFGFF